MYFVLISALLWSVLLGALFIDASGGFTLWDVNTKLFYEYANIIGVFLLAGTLFFQIRSFQKQQVESKFYEMVKYYRENISEMRFRNPFYYKIADRENEEEFVTGRRVVKTIFDQYKTATKLVKQETSKKALLDFSMVELDCLKHLKAYHGKSGIDTQIKIKLNELYLQNNLAYLITFWGVPHATTLELEDRLTKVLKDYLIDKSEREKLVKHLISESRKLITVYECNKEKRKYSGGLKKVDKPLLKCDNARDKIKFFGGHQYHLAHYFRHFFVSVKYIDKQPKWLISPSQKKEYVGLLRAQMSNYEQALLFINSLSVLGENWEYSGKYDFISKYDLIRNLPKNFISDINPECFYPSVDYEWS